MSKRDGHVDTLVLTWTFGVILAYAAIIAFVSWMTFQSVLLVQAYFDGNFSYIQWKLTRYLYLAVGYFGLGIILKKTGVI
jgi:hypothetical protein